MAFFELQVHDRKYACASRLSDRTPLFQTNSNYVDCFCRQSNRLDFFWLFLGSNQMSTGPGGFMFLSVFFMSGAAEDSTWSSSGLEHTRDGATIVG